MQGQPHLPLSTELVLPRRISSTTGLLLPGGGTSHSLFLMTRVVIIWVSVHHSQPLILRIRSVASVTDIC